jgi:hypothetical protein
MTLITSAISAISKSDMSSLSNCLKEMSKGELQELASNYNANSATIYMDGSWMESLSGNLVDNESQIIQENIKLDRWYGGIIEQYYEKNSLYLAALIAIDYNINSDFDEDYFTIGTMIFGKEYQLSADDCFYDADCNHEERHIRLDEISDEVDVDECNIEDDSSDIKLGYASLLATKIELILNDKKTITLPLFEASPKEQWFIFALLFMSSKKSISEISFYHDRIKSFMEENFN